MMSKAMSKGVDGVSVRVTPPAAAPMSRNELTISIAKRGPLSSSHQKKPVKMVKRTSSAKKSPMSALRSASMPNVQTIEMVASVQNNQVA